MHLFEHTIRIEDLSTYCISLQKSRWALTFGSFLSPNLFSSSAKHQATWLSYSEYYPCNIKTCRYGHLNLCGKTFMSSVTEEQLDIKQYINCGTIYVVYLIFCISCNFAIYWVYNTVPENQNWRALL